MNIEFMMGILTDILAFVFIIAIVATIKFVCEHNKSKTVELPPVEYKDYVIEPDGTIQMIKHVDIRV